MGAKHLTCTYWMPYNRGGMIWRKRGAAMSETKDMCYRCRNFTQYYLKKTDGSFRRAYYGRCRVLYTPVHVYFGACEFFEAKSQENRSDEI